MKSVYKRCFVVAALVWAGCLIALLAAYMLVLAPQGRSRKQIDKKFVEAKNAYNQTVATTKHGTKARLSKQIEDLRARLKQFVIYNEDLANLTFDISQIAGQMNVSSFSIKGKDNAGAAATPSGSEANVVEKQIQVSFTAGFNQFASFLNALERNQPVLFVDEFTITHAGQSGSGHQVDMRLAVFVRKHQDS